MATIRTSIQIQDNMSRAFQSMNTAMNVVLNSFESLQAASGRAVDTASIQLARQELARAGAAFDQVEQEIQQANGAQQQFNNEIRAGTSAADSLLNKLMGIAAAYLSFQSVKNFVGGMLSQGIDFIAFRQASEVAFTTFLGDAETAKKYMDDMYAFALKTPFAYPDLLESSRNLIAFGVAAENTFPIMQSIGDAVAAIGGGNAEMSSLSNIFGQIQAQGRITAMEVNRLSQFGINAYEMLGQAAGESAEAMKKQISSGAIGVGQAISGLVEGMDAKFGGLMEGVKGTWAGAVDSMKSASRNAGTAMMEEFMVAEGPLVTLVQNITEQIKKIPEYIGPAVAAFIPLINVYNEIVGDGRLDNLFSGLSSTIIFTANLLSWTGQIAIQTAAAISDNWSMIEPVMWGVVASLIVYNATMGFAWLTTLRTIGAKLWSIAVSWAETAAIIALTFAQQGLNAALLACPITWIIIGIIAIIAIFYAAVAAVNHFAGTTISATGIIVGVLMTALAFIGNIFIAAGNLIIDVIALIWNGWASFAEFFANVFNDPIGSIVRLFADLGDHVLGILGSIASAIDTLFGSNLASAVSGWRNALSGMVTEVYGEAEIKVPRMDASDLHFDRFEYGKAYDFGYNLGAKIEDKLSFGGASDNIPRPEMGQGLSALDIAKADPADKKNKANTAKNTAKMAKSMEASEEDLKYLRDLAERDVINRFTTASVKVDFSSTNTINSDLDLDGIIDQFAEKLEEALDVAAEGA
ncbi:tape measure protein [Sporosarcina sp. FSL K6-1508]|uniref:tape measure protein n=1 Tax=Sporosarcina sp. FSL K6-1508 TaxID=2921553 RepID=UPI0030F6D009